MSMASADAWDMSLDRGVGWNYAGEGVETISRVRLDVC